MSRSLVFALLVSACSTPVFAAPINSATSQVSGGTLVDFEGQVDGTLISNQYPGLTFSQTPAGSPMIDNQPFLFGYVQSSGVAVLTGSNQNNTFPTVAGLIIDFATPVGEVEAFMSDTAPLGNYTVQAFGAGNVLLETIAFGGALINPGRYLGFSRPQNDIFRVQFGPSTVGNDAFSIDDLRFAAVPEPTSMLAFGIVGAAGAVFGWRRRRVTQA